MSSNYHKPESVNFKLSENIITAVVSKDGVTKFLPGGKKSILTAEMFRSVNNKWGGRPIYANHIPTFKLGEVLDSVVSDKGELIHTLRIDDEKALTLIQNDAFLGFSPGFKNEKTIFAADGRMIETEPDHMAIMFYPFKPVCGKDSCGVIFMDNGTNRSCLCGNDQSHKVELVKFGKDMYNQCDAIKFMKENGKEFRGYRETDGYHEFSMTENFSDKELKETHIDSGISAFVSFGEIKHEEVSISPDDNKESEKMTIKGNEFNDGAAAAAETSKDNEKAPIQNTVLKQDDGKMKELESRLGKVELAEKYEKLAGEEKKAKEELSAKFESREKELLEKISAYEKREKETFAATLPELDADLKETFDIKAESWADLDMAEMKRIHKIISKLKPATEEKKTEKVADDDVDVEESEIPAGEKKQDNPARSFYDNMYKRKK